MSVTPANLAVNIDSTAGNNQFTPLFVAPSDGSLFLQNIHLILKNATGATDYNQVAYVFYLESDTGEGTVFYPSLTNGTEMFSHGPEMVKLLGVISEMSPERIPFTTQVDVLTGEKMYIAFSFLKDGTDNPCFVTGCVETIFETV